MPKLPIVKPTETEKLIWSRNTRNTRNTPKKTGGLVRNKAFVFADVLRWSDWYREPDKMNPEDWERKLLAGCRGEWFTHVVEGRTRVLDVGCGFGFPSFYLARYGHEVTGVDPSPSEIATAKALFKIINPPGKVSFQVIGESRLPFADNSFDAATLGHSLECMAEPETLLSELNRVLKPGSPIAIEEEDRSTEPRNHPVWEKTYLAFFDEEVWLWYETRIRDPYTDRRYMIKVNASGEVARSIEKLAEQVIDREKDLPTVDLVDTGIHLNEILTHITEARYSEARGYDRQTLAELLAKSGFTEIRSLILPNGTEFAQSLAKQSLLENMPDDVRGVLRALVKTIPASKLPASTTVSCRTP